MPTTVMPPGSDVAQVEPVVQGPVFPPHLIDRPVSVSAMPFEYDKLMATIRSPAVTPMKLLIGPVGVAENSPLPDPNPQSPLPTTPNKLFPQHMTSPLFRSAHAVPRPTESAATSVRPATVAAGLLYASAPALPVCPLPPVPQHFTVASDMIAQLESLPTANDAAPLAST
ncbi:MAG: hypothetical protein RLZ18_949 [Actinomycetota bacterium]